MTTDAQDKQIAQLAADLPEQYRLAYISKPTPTSVKYVFQHTVAISFAEALAVIQAAQAAH